MSEVQKTIEDRRSLRIFGEEKITAEDMDKIIKAAILAPTAGNMMLYSILKITDRALLAELAKSCDNQDFIAKCDQALIFVVDWQKWQDYYQMCGVPQKCAAAGQSFYTPHEGEFMLAAQDALIAAQNAVIMAESLGIGSCYIGDIMEHVEHHKKLLNLPHFTFPLAMITLGHYPKDFRPPARPRFDPRFVVFENAYKQLSKEELGEMFEGRAFPKDRFENFGQYMYDRKNGTDFILEMSRSVRALLDSWTKK